MNNTRMVFERRCAMRTSFDLAVKLKQVKEDFSAKIHNSFSKDLSETGIQLSSFYFYPVNSRIMLETALLKDAEPVTIVGKVVWIEQFPYQERYKVGVEFVDLSQEIQLQLRDSVLQCQRLEKLPVQGESLCNISYNN
ncbi:MAG: PilZ domain-containing protein [Candidatus Omnitrophota bacterium]